VVGYRWLMYRVVGSGLRTIISLTETTIISLTETTIISLPHREYHCVYILPDKNKL